MYPSLVWPLGHQFVSKSTNLYLFQSKVFLCCCVFCTFPQFCFRFLSTDSSHQGPSSRRSWPLSMYGLRSSTWGCNGHFSTWSWRWNYFPPLNKLVVKYQLLKTMQKRNYNIRSSIGSVRLKIPLIIIILDKFLRNWN